MKLYKTDYSMPPERKLRLDGIKSRLEDIRSGTICFVCTHNSRRSQFAQFWFDNIAQANNLSWNVLSAGTEATAVYPSVITALEHDGITLQYENKVNPHYTSTAIRHPLYSKTIEELSSTVNIDLAITVCDHADQNCPIIPNVRERSHLPYIDPKHSDGSNHEASTYLETSRMVRQEMQYLLTGTI